MSMKQVLTEVHTRGGIKTVMMMICVCKLKLLSFFPFNHGGFVVYICGPTDTINMPVAGVAFHHQAFSSALLHSWLEATRWEKDNINNLTLSKWILNVRHSKVKLCFYGQLLKARDFPMKCQALVLEKNQFAQERGTVLPRLWTTWEGWPQCKKRVKNQTNKQTNIPKIHNNPKREGLTAV